MTTTITWEENPITCCAAILIASFSLTILIIPHLLHMAKTKGLYDEPRQGHKIHRHPIPRLGGAAIFLSFTIVLLLSVQHTVLPLNYLLTACILIFALGIKDDLCGVTAATKFLITFIAVLLLVIPGQIQLDNLYGLFSINELPLLSSTMLSAMILLFITHAFNLIDGIDGLAAAIGIMAMLVFTVLFINMDQYELAATSISMMGALLGFLKFNLTPARLFMGDTGSLLIGLVSAVLGLKLIAISATPLNTTALTPPVAMLMVTVLLIIPVFDTLRVCFIRMTRGRSPFQGDKNHIHHRLIQLGYSHIQTTAILILLNGLMIGSVFLFLM